MGDRKLAIVVSLALATVALPGVAVGQGGGPGGCQTVSTSRGSMSAKVVASAGDRITGPVDALGCDIGVYVGPSADGAEVVRATVEDALDFGVYNDGATDVDVERSDISKIGNHDNAGNFDPSGAQTGLGVLYDNGGTGTIAHNDISQYQKGGIVANHAGTDAEIRRNTVTGLDKNPGIAQNGIQIGFGADGLITQNDVDGNWFTGDDWSASGILVFETDGITVQKNTIANSELGVGVGTFGGFGSDGQSTANNTKIVNNEIRDGEEGVSLQAIDWFGDAYVNNTKIVNNRITDMEDDGVEGFATDFDPDFEAVLDNNKVIRNQFQQIGDDRIDLDEAQDSKIQANT